MPTVRSMLGEGTQSVLLTVSILEHLAAAEGPVSLSELSRRIDASKSRIYRHLQTMAACDFVVRVEPEGTYEVGGRLLALSNAVRGRRDLAGIAGPVLQELHRTTGHTVVLGRAARDGVHVLSSLHSESPIMLAVREGTVLPFETSAQGRVALAFLPRQRRDADAPVAAALERMERDHPGELERIAERGYARAQMREGLMGLAAPILSSRGVLVGTVAMLDTSATMQAGIARGEVEQLKSAARAISDLFAPPRTGD